MRRPIPLLPKLRLWWIWIRYDMVGSYDSLLDGFQCAIRDLTAARRHNEELHGLLQPRWDRMQGFVDFVQHRYDVSQGRLRQAVQRESEAVQLVDRQRDEPQQLDTLRVRYTELETMTTDAYIRLQTYAAELERHITVGTSPTEAVVHGVAGELLNARHEIERVMFQANKLANDIQTAEGRYSEAEEACDQARAQSHDEASSVRSGETVDGLRLKIHTRSEPIGELEKDLTRVRSCRDSIRQEQDRAVQRHKEAETAAAADLGRATGLERDCARAADTLLSLQDAHMDLRKKYDQTVRIRDSFKSKYDHDDAYRAVEQKLHQAQTKVADLEHDYQSTQEAAQDEIRRLVEERDTATQDREDALKARDSAAASSHDGCKAVQRDYLNKIADIQNAYIHMRGGFEDLVAEQDSLVFEHQGLQTGYEVVVGERDSALDRLATIASTVLPGFAPVSLKRTRDGSAGSDPRGFDPTGYDRPSKKSRSTP
ncbi:hypothetical protein PHMEG_0004913 [Phytophthora megakarya]|uniref:RB1-inducible coiled-coil protein 1 isoform X2 n=1 Tax=Phytophthora megakarya TaxID=4795 RepID=A0A225WSR4_9STRA|nr:RB1-inducible coiled-coil protein 1 isoform X2 [Phytophthora megakarya]OWZ20631.1 hypothetical protein PHMEG_0004913 [Phytophthora megakarya]